MDDPKCPVHPKVYLQQRPTWWGIVWRCPIHGCTVVWWGKTNTSPSDYATRKARLRAHEWIDPVWKNKRMTRKKLYEKMQAELGIEHIGLCDAEQCERIIEWAKKIEKGD